MNSNFSSRCSLPQQPSISAFSWYSRRCSRSFAGTRARPSILTPAVHDEFYANKVSSFLDLGVHEDLTRALERNGLAKPAKVQEVVVPALLEDKSAVVAAETGSGKTFAYLLPIATSLMRSKNETRRPPIALVLCPNVALCQQVIAAITSLKDTEGDSLLSACQVNSSNPPPFDRPDFVVATPAGLLDLFINSQGAYGGLWTLNGFQEHVKYVVLDEADLLLDQAYIQAVSRILEAFRVSDRRKVEAQSILEMGMTDLAFSRLPRHLRHACWKGGAPGLMDAGYRKGTKSETGQFGPYWQRQYVFVAATMPAVTRSDVGSQIQKMYPDIQWIATEALHTSKKQITHQWAEVADDNWGDRLVQVIQEDPDYKQGSAKILVFAKDTASADLASKLLTSSGVPHGVYHKRRPLAERNESLRRMQESQSGVLVCTDSAARGLDIPDVSHVIQSDFAANTIDFIHRIGRTGRAAKAGKVTSLYREHNVPLVDVIKAYITEGRPLEDAFSRARSFSQKMKRKGRFVPRGKVAIDVGDSSSARQRAKAVA